MSERWRAIKGYEGYYEVSSLGRVCSLHSGHGKTPGRLKKLSDHARGYKFVKLHRRDGSCRAPLVHRLVVEAFIGPIPDGYEVNHIDGDKRNNCVTNLEIVTRQQNIDHAVATGLISNKGERNSQSKLTAEQVREIRDRHRRGVAYGSLAKEYGVSVSLVRQIVNRLVWSHL